MPKSKNASSEPDALFDNIDEQKSEKAPKVVWENRDDIRPIVMSLIEQFPEQLHHIQPSRIAYLGFSKKKSKILAFVKPIRGVYELLVNNDYVLAVYLENWVQRTPAEKRLLIMHELMHLPDGGFEARHKNFRKTVDHDVKDFAFIIRNYGVYWEGSDKIMPAKSEPTATASKNQE